VTDIIPPPHVRRASLDDVPELVRLINVAYRVEDFFVSGDRTSPEDLEARMADTDCSFLVIESGDGSLAGALYVRVRGERGYFGMLSIDPSRQKQGLGSRLIRAAEEHCRDAGCRFLDLDVVNLRTELPAFYASMGFAPFDVAPFPTPQKLRRDAHLILMTKPLVEL
jgi:N-acetylglutamate synthase-like GNAT family acetyltransferase